jgi:hypothetical protein
VEPPDQSEWVVALHQSGHVAAEVVETEEKWAGRRIRAHPRRSAAAVTDGRLSRAPQNVDLEVETGAHRNRGTG